jgi:hypothetical protein
MAPLLDLPDDLLTQIVELMFEGDVTAFWALSRVSPTLKSLVEAAAARRRHLGGDASAACLRKRTTLAEPALPLKRLLSCMPNLVTLDLSGAYWWVRAGGGAAAVGEAIANAPFAPHLEVLRLDHCEELDDAALDRLLRPPGRRSSMRVHLPPPMMRAVVAHLREGGMMEAADGDAPTYLGAPPALPRLRELSLRSCRRLTCPQFLYWTPALERLDLAWCAKIRGLGTLPLRQATPRLRLLDVTGVEDGGGWGGMPASGLPRGVRELCLAMTSLSDDGLGFLAERLPELRRLTLSRRADNLWADGRFTDAGVAEFKRRRPEVEVVFVSA